jgi:DNA-binding PadR family transcriptional regulator
MAKTPSNLDTLVLLALARLENKAYGVTIREELVSVTGRDVSLAAVYAALDRLDAQGLIEPWLSEPLPERGGRARRHFRLAPSGEAALRHEREILTRLWTGVTLEPRTGER